jgi:transposase
LNVKTIGIDPGKTIFHIVGMDERGSIVLRRKLSRTQLLTFLANTPACLTGMEASCGAHYTAREAAVYGHEMRLIPAQFVRPFVKSQKNDYVDAEAIAEAVQRPTMRFVPVKTTDQLDLQAIHRVRDRLIERRTSVINQFRAFLFERGIVFRSGRQHLFKALSSLLAEAELKMSPIMFRLLAIMVDEWLQIEVDIEKLDQETACFAARDAACQRLLAVPGVGPLTATAMIAAVGNGAAFSKGRQFAAWLGLVPKQVTTGGKPKLPGFSKRGNEDLRRLFVRGARSVMARANRTRLGFGDWLSSLESRANSNVVNVALANKIARIAWAVLNRGFDYH